MSDLRRRAAGIRGYFWLWRRFGARRTLLYARARREGRTIDYSHVLTADQLARLGEHFDPAPWELS